MYCQELVTQKKMIMMMTQRRKKNQIIEKKICNGPVKPCITFFGESLPEKYIWGWDRIRNKKIYPLTE